MAISACLWSLSWHETWVCCCALCASCTVLGHDQAVARVNLVDHSNLRILMTILAIIGNNGIVGARRGRECNLVTVGALLRNAHSCRFHILV